MSFEAAIRFQKMSNRNITDITDSANHKVSSDNGTTGLSETTLTFLKFTQSDAGVYTCTVMKPDGNPVSSQDMTVFILNGIG